MSDTSSDFWVTETFPNVLAEFSRALKRNAPGSDEQLLAWLKLGLVGHVRGHAFIAAKAVHRLMRKLHAARHELWGGMFSPAGSAIVHFKMAVALAECPDSPRRDVLEMSGFFDEAARHHGIHPKAAPLARLAINLRLGDLDGAAALFPVLHEWWLERNLEAEANEVGNGPDHASDEKKQEDSGPSMPVCGSGTAQILIEFLLAANRTDEAIAIADRILERKGCGSPCEAGPHGALGWMLNPLLDQGKADQAERILPRCRLLAPTVDLRHVAAAGDRILFLGRIGRLDEAISEWEKARKTLEQGGPSPWERLRLAGQMARALPLIGPTLRDRSPESLASATNLVTAGSGLARKFDLRNGNSHVSEFWEALMKSVGIQHREPFACGEGSAL